MFWFVSFCINMSFLYPICKIVANLLINFLIYNS